MLTSCRFCPLRSYPVFAPMSSAEADFMESFKVDEISVPPNTTLLTEGYGSEHLFTVLEGVGLRFKLLPDGRRQVLNFLFPGDFLGLQAGVMGEMKHSVTTSSAMRLCVFRRSQLMSLFREFPERGFDLTWVGAVEEHFLGEALAQIGQSTALTRVSWALAKLYRRARAVGMVEEGACRLPFRQRDLADALGLSLVHTNKTLARLRILKVASWSGDWLRVHDFETLARLGQVEGDLTEQRPLI